MRCYQRNENYDSGTIIPRYGEAAVPRMHTYAVWSMLMAILGICVPVGLMTIVLAIPLAISALVQIHREPALYRGQWVATGSLALVVMLGMFIYAPLLCSRLPMTQSQRPSEQTTCISHQKQLALAMQLYREEHDNHLPCNFTLLHDIPSRTLVCPEEQGLSYGYGLNWNARGQSLADIDTPAKIILTADGGNHCHYLTSRLDIDGRRHGTGFVASFIDGHVEMMKPGAQVQLQLD